MGVDNVGVGEMGVYEVGVYEMGSRRSGMTPYMAVFTAESIWNISEMSDTMEAAKNSNI